MLMSSGVCLAAFTLSSLHKVELKAGTRSSELAMKKQAQLGLQVLQFDLAEDIVPCPKLSLQANLDPIVFHALPYTFLNKAEKYF